MSSSRVCLIICVSPGTPCISITEDLTMFKKYQNVYSEKQTKLKEGSNKPLKVALKRAVFFWHDVCKLSSYYIQCVVKRTPDSGK